jgi:hypothetical protein
MPRREDRDREPCAACQRREDRKAMVERDELWYGDTCAETHQDGETKERHGDVAWPPYPSAREFFARLHRRSPVVPQTSSAELIRARRDEP